MRLGQSTATGLPSKRRAPLAMHSAASPDWGTPMVLRRFAASVLAPAAKGSAIDLDYASSAYWQSWWPEPTDQPRAFLDGSKGRDVLIEADRRAADPCPGSGFFNPPGLRGGDMVQECWALFEEDHRAQKLGSGCWLGFSIEQLGSLQNVGERNPLTTGRNDLISTIVPSRRANYVLHPEQLISITLRKQKAHARRSKQWLVEQHLVEKLRARSTGAPVSAGAPSHLSYVTFLWHLDRDVRRAQMSAAQQFLKDQGGNPKSLLYKFEAIGPL
jgi:hypothetical protein